MRKIGSLFLYFFAILFFGFSAIANAQSPSVDATLSETNIYSGERVSLEISISGTNMGNVPQPELPEIDGLRWLRGSSSRGSKYTFSGGKPSVTYTFGYALIAQQPGEYTLPAIDVEVDGEQYQTDPISFKVLDPATINQGDAERAPDIYVQLEPSTQQPVVGQQVIADVVLYFKNGIEVSSYQPTPGWKAEGFWKEELQYPQRAQTSSTIISGVRYNKAILLQHALFPTKSGELTISPFEITVAVRTQRNSTPFGFGLGQERMNLESSPVTLNVQPLPSLDEAQFIGAVGKFDISRSISSESVFVGETVEISTTIEGIGNVPLINKPEFDFPEALENYAPQERSEIARRQRQISGTRTFTDILVPRNEGTFTIPEKKVAYFNPEQKRYIIETLPALTFNAIRDPNSTATVQQDVRLDVKPITGLANWHTVSQQPLYKKYWVWIGILLPLIITALMYSYKTYSDRMQTDPAFARSRTAADNAQKTLSAAEQSSDVKEGYHLIEKALVQFITDKLNLPPAGLSHQDIIKKTEELGDTDVIAELKRLLTKCETISYAPNASQQSLEADIQKTRTLIKKVAKLV